MKLQSRARLLVLVLFSALIVLIVGVSGRAFMRGLAAAERREAHEIGKRAARIVDVECDGLVRISRDYAEWNDTVAFVQERDPAYAAGNWKTESMRNVQVDAMLIFTPLGELAGGAVVPATGEEVVAPSQELIGRFRDEIRQVVGDEEAALRLSGLCRIGERAAFFACLPVLPTGGEGRPQGALVTVRWIDNRLRDRLEQVLGFRVELVPAASAEAPSSAPKRLAPDARVTVLSDEKMAVGVLLRAIDGGPLFGLQMEIERAVYLEGVRARRMMLWQLLAAAVVVALLTAWGLRVCVVRRLERLSAQLSEIGEQARARGRVRVDGADEIAAVGRSINGMIENLERADLERARARKERELLQEQLLHAQKMEAIGEFAGGVAHDFNNCLTSIGSWLQLTRQELPADHPTQENLELALNSVEHATSVVRQLLTYSRHGAAPLAELRLGELLSESLLLLRSGLPRTIELRVHAGGGDDRVFADRTQLLQVLMNLLNNARDAMGDSGVLTISLAEATLPSAATGPANHLPPGDYVRLSVQDTGPGIPPDHLERIFKPFFTTKAAGKGTGLGLAVVQSVVCRHSGAVWVESAPGQGTTFHVLLPRRSQQASGGLAPGCAEPGLQGLRVLMAEDDPEVTRVLLTALRRRGCEVVAAEDGAAAWETLVLADRPFDVVLTDLTMPRLSGMQLVGKIVDSGRKIPVVLMTAYGSTLDAEHVRQAGFAAVLTKPVIHDQVLEVLARVTGRHAPPPRP